MSQIIISIKQGEVLDIDFTITKNGTAADLSGATVLFEVKRAPQITTTAFISKTITESSDINTIGQITDPTSGRFSVHLSSTDTSYAVGEYYLVLWIKQDGQEDIISSTCNANGLFRICEQ